MCITTAKAHCFLYWVVSVPLTSKHSTDSRPIKQRQAMDKSSLLTKIIGLQKELDALMDMVIAMEDSKPEQALQIQTENDGWLTVSQVCSELHISDSTFYEWLNQGLLPPGLEFGPRSKRWKMSDIRAWQASKQNRDDFAKSTGERHNTQKRRGRVSRIRKQAA